MTFNRLKTSSLFILVTGFEREEGDRPEFIGEQKRSVVDGSWKLSFPAKESARRQRWSAFVILLLVAFVIAVVAVIFYLKLYFSKSDDVAVRTYGPVVTNAANGIFIQVSCSVTESLSY